MASLDPEFDAFDRVLVPVRTVSSGDRASYSLIYEDFEDIEEYGTVLEKYYGAQQAHLHELAHGRTALAVGATSIKYSLEIREYGNYGERAGERLVERAVTRIISDEQIPVLARLAINAAPIDPSYSDYEPIRRFYGSLNIFTDRIKLWNDSDEPLRIPLPGEMDDRRK